MGLGIARLSGVGHSLASDTVQTSAEARRNLVNPSDELFFSLEGRAIESRGDTWRIEVCGVHSAAYCYWVQLNLRGPVQCELTLRTEQLDAAQIVDIVRDWLNDSMSSDVEPCLVGKAYKAAVRH